jgi:uncharacterized membrane protein
MQDAQTKKVEENFTERFWSKLKNQGGKKTKHFHIGSKIYEFSIKMNEF